MSNTSKTKNESAENFIDAAQLVDSHRAPVAWMLIVQIAVLGILSTWLMEPPLSGGLAMMLLLACILWFGKTFWLLLFCLVVFGGQAFRIQGYEIRTVEGPHLLESILIVLILIAGFRYIELRTYRDTYDLSRSYRRLKTSKRRNWATALRSISGQFIRRQWYSTVIAIVASFALLSMFATTDYLTQEYWLQPEAGRFIFLAMILFFPWFVCRSVISIWDWFLLTPKQADVAFRSWANREFWRETAGVQRRKEKMRIEDLV